MRRFLTILLLGLASALPARVFAKDGLVEEKTRVLKGSETLADVARDFYGSPHYALLIVKHNKLADAKAVAAGGAVKLADLGDVLVANGVKKDLMDDYNAIVSARYEYMKVRGELQKVLAATPKGQKAKVPSNVAKELVAVAGVFESSAKSLAKKGKYGDSPTRLKNRLVEAATNMRKLAKGTNKPELDDKIHLLVAQAWVRAIMWAKNEDGDD